MSVERTGYLKATFMTHLANIKNTLETLTTLENLRRTHGATYLFRSYVEDEKGRDLGTNSVEVKRRDGNPLTDGEVAMLKDSYSSA
jgi:hypothetical protein